MIALLNDDANADTDGQEPSATMRSIAKKLTERGLNVRVPSRERSCRLTVTNSRLTVTKSKRARCEIAVEDDEIVGFQYFPQSGGNTGPTEISEIVLGLLGADNTGPAELYTHLHEGATLGGAVAREMQARGLRADLKIYEDKSFYDVAVEIQITNPARHERGLVYLADDGVIQWECDYGETTEGAETVADTTAEILNNSC